MWKYICEILLTYWHTSTPTHRLSGERLSSSPFDVKCTGEFSGCNFLNSRGESAWCVSEKEGRQARRQRRRQTRRHACRQICRNVLRQTSGKVSWYVGRTWTGKQSVWLGWEAYRWAGKVERQAGMAVKVRAREPMTNMAGGRAGSWVKRQKFIACWRACRRDKEWGKKRDERASKF